MNDVVKVAFVEYSARCLGEFLAREKLASKKTKLTRTSMKCALDMGAIKPPNSMISRFANAAPHLNEVAGLGILAAPSVMNLAGKPMDDHTAHAMELGGLGVLATPSAYHAGKALLGKAIH